ncbi:MerC domain-containing protein [Flammeovirga pectinis]|uniref:MerC domain-containing protein n=1 Tax=Flammeovirga pectinis TaxID=2494373 RepID=A0A3S9P519_9BACT|nr:MerC domain-containing protein [Flammeovirga pectinis]AZQ63297.1 MerC domain-containing protein [Flammeovirga pectinis]
MNSLTLKSDFLGALTSFLCLLHCIATPFLFIVDSCNTSGCCEASPVWWKQFDLLFVFISFIAVYRSIKLSKKQLIQSLFAISWLGLFFIVLNEQLQFISLHENLIFVPSISLIVLHIYNKRDCRCSGKTCCG